MATDPPVQSIFITGVHTGLGHGFAEELLSRGDAAVVGISRNEPADLAGVDNFLFVSCDLTVEESVATAVRHAAEHLRASRNRSTLDLAILNAGMLGRLEDLVNLSLDELRDVMHLNVWANKLVLDSVFNDFEQVRQVVTISSGASVNGNRGWGGYSISKAALNMLTKLYAKEFPDCHFCALAPGLIDTAMQDQICAGPPDERFPSRERLRSKRNTPDMPGPRDAARHILPLIKQLPERVESGAYVDIRDI